MKHWIIFLAVFSMALSSKAQEKKLKFFPAYASYEQEVQLFEDGKSKLTLEQLYSKANSLSDLWREDVSIITEAGISKKNLLKPYDELIDKPPLRFQFRIHEETYAVPVLSFYEQLEKRRGDQADQAYFKRMLEFYGAIKLWPNYEKKLDHWSKCTDFSDGRLTKPYGRWTQFRAHYPNAYKDEVEAVLNVLKEALTTGCDCDSKKSWKQELHLFIKTYPKSELTPILKKRLFLPTNAVPTGNQDPTHFHCPLLG